MRAFTVVLMVALCTMWPIQTYAQSNGDPLIVNVIQGEGAVIDAAHMTGIVVRVSQAGADVTFRVSSSSGVSLPGGVTQITVRSDEQGVAKSGALTASAKGGTFEVEVTAKYMGQTATATVHETNGFTEVAAKSATHKSHTKLWVAIIGAGAAGGLLAAMKKGDPGAAGAAPPLTIVAGSPTVGAPQ